MVQYFLEQRQLTPNIEAYRCPWRKYFIFCYLLCITNIAYCITNVQLIKYRHHIASKHTTHGVRASRSLYHQHDAIQLHHNILIRGGYSCCCSAIVVDDKSRRRFQCDSTVWTSNSGLLLLRLLLRLLLLFTIKIL